MSEVSDVFLRKVRARPAAWRRGRRVLGAAGWAAAVACGAEPTDPPPASGEQIAFFSARTADSTYRLYVVPASGGTPRFLDVPAILVLYAATWAPDGAHLAVTIGRTTGGYFRQIAVIDTVGRELRQVTTGLGDADSPAWSPDGSTIAYFNNGYQPDSTQRGWGINLIAVDGAGMRRLPSTSGLAGAGRPSWSPTGSHLAFIGLRTGIYVMRADGSALRQLTDSPGIREVAWSPAGGVLAFSEEVDGGDRTMRRVGLINEDGSGKHYLTDGPLDLDVSWAPDGRWVAYTSHDNGNAEVYLFDTTTGQQRRLTTSSGYDGRAAWGPRRRP